MSALRLIASVKQLGRKKAVIGAREILLDETPSDLRGLIGLIVAQEVARYNEKNPEEWMFLHLSQESIDDAAESGKVGFGARYNEKNQDLEAAVDNALQSFEDGLFRVFVNDEEAEILDAPLSLKNDDRLTFVRLVMLAGRLW